MTNRTATENQLLRNRLKDQKALLKEIKDLVVDLGWYENRMSSSGQISYDKLWKKVQGGILANIAEELL